MSILIVPNAVLGAEHIKELARVGPQENMVACRHSDAPLNKLTR